MRLSTMFITKCNKLAISDSAFCRITSVLVNLLPLSVRVSVRVSGVEAGGSQIKGQLLPF